MRRRKVFSVCDGQRTPSVSPYLILQFDARAQEAFCALGKHVSAILQYVSIRGQKFHLPFNELARAAIDVHCLLFNRPFHWRVTSFPRLLACYIAACFFIASRLQLFLFFRLKARVLREFTYSWEKSINIVILLWSFQWPDI